MSHNIGRTVPVSVPRIGPDGPLSPVASGVWEYAFTPQNALSGGPPRFVILHLTALSLPGTSTVEVELGYAKDVITSAVGSEAWSRPVDPTLGPVVIRFKGTAGGVTLSDYGSGEPWATDYPPGSELFESTTNGDPFLHTNPYQEPSYQTWLKCGGVFNWQNAACAVAGSVQEETAKAVGMIINYHQHDGAMMVSTCSVTLIDTNLVLTARHCVSGSGQLEARSGSVTFDYGTTCAGAKPAAFAPTFHKVRAIRAMGVADTVDDDWAILEIDPPPAGPVPRQLRPAGPVNGEPVFTVHHPNGAVKKFQTGSMSGNDVNSFSNFDYAGGSSGSSLFDASGQIIGAALSVGPSSCLVGYSPAGSVLTALANPPAPVAPYDLMLAIDRSGSMSALGTSGPGRTKLIEARDASSLFVQLVQTGAGHRIGMVSFSTAATIDTAPGNFTNGQQNQLVGPTAPYDGGDIGALVAGGMTSIGDALVKSMTALTGLSANGNQRAILLMTDGMHNTAPSVATGEGMLGATKLNVVGFGSDWQLDGALMSRLARDHGGQYTRANDGLELTKFFALSFGNIFESGSLVDPVTILAAGQVESDPIPFDVCEEDRITVIVGWDDPNASLEAVIRTPNGVVVATGGGVTTDAARTWWFAKIALPAMGERAGHWTAVVRRQGAGDDEVLDDDVDIRVVEGEAHRLPAVRAFLSVVPSGGPVLRALPPTRRLYTGDRISPHVSLRYPDGSTPHADVTLTIDGPAGSLGALVAERGLSKEGGTPGGEPIAAFEGTLAVIATESGGQLPIARGTRTLELFDDGMHDDGAMEGDGIYGNPVDDLFRYEGTYKLHALASYEAGEDCHGQREVTWSLDVAPGIDASTSTVDVSTTGTGPDGRPTGTIAITPRDRYGNPLGPGRGDRFTVSPAPGTSITGPVNDNGDGSYSVPVSWDAGGQPGVLVAQPDRDPVPLTPGGGATGAVPWWCRPWIPWLLLLLLVVIVVLLILLLA